MELALLVFLLVLFSPVILVYRILSGDRAMPPKDRLRW